MPFVPGLAELSAEYTPSLGNSELQQATSLVKLSVISNHQISTLSPFAVSLRELNIAHSLVHLSEVRHCSQLVSLNYTSGPLSLLGTSSSLCRSLLELDAVWCGSHDDNNVPPLTSLIRLDVSHNNGIRSVDFCAQSLRP